MAQSSDDPTKVVVTPKTIYIAKPKQNIQDTSNNDDSYDLALASGIIFIDDIFELSYVNNIFIYFIVCIYCVIEWYKLEYRPMKREKAVKLVSKIFKNIIENPNEAKFRRINASKINSKFPMQVIQLLQAVCVWYIDILIPD